MRGVTDRDGARQSLGSQTHQQEARRGMHDDKVGLPQKQRPAINMSLGHV